MMNQSNIIAKAIKTLSRLPGIGERSAQRIILSLLQKDNPLLQNLIMQLTMLEDQVVTCSLCNNLDTSSPCSICSSINRNNSQICVVQDISSLWALEKSKAFKGYYFVLGGILQTNNTKLEQKTIPQLLQRIRQCGATELILANPITVEGQATSLYIKEEVFKIDPTIEVSTLAQGIPVGGEIDYLDELTLETAVKLRRGL